MYKVLNSGNYDAYLDHVKENMDNCRVEDPDLLPKIKLGLEKGVYFFSTCLSETYCIALIGL